MNVNNMMFRSKKQDSPIMILILDFIGMIPSSPAPTMECFQSIHHQLKVKEKFKPKLVPIVILRKLKHPQKR